MAMRIVKTEDGKTMLVGDTCPPDQKPAVAPSKPEWYSRWEPRPDQIRFFEEMLPLLKDGAEWTVSATGCVYKVNHKDKKLILLRGAIDEWHWKNAKTLEKIGWTVELASRTMETGSGKTSALSIDVTKPVDTLADRLLTKSLSQPELTPPLGAASPSTISDPGSAMDVPPSADEQVARRRQILHQWLSQQGR